MSARFLGFKSKWRMYVDSGSVPSYDKDKAFTTVDDVIIKSSIQGYRIADGIKGVILNGFNTKLSQAYTYRLNNFPEGTTSMSITAGAIDDNKLSLEEQDLLKRQLIKDLCRDFDEDYNKFKDMPDVDLPFNFVNYSAFTAPESIDELVENHYESAVIKLYNQLPDNFHSPDMETGNIRYTNKETIIIPPKELEDGETGIEDEGNYLVVYGEENDLFVVSIEGTEILNFRIPNSGKNRILLPEQLNAGVIVNVLQYRDILINDEETLDLIEEFDIEVFRTVYEERKTEYLLNTSKFLLREEFVFEDLDEKYYKVKVPFSILDKPILSISSPVQTGYVPLVYGEDDDGKEIVVSGGEPIYKIFYDKTKRTYIDVRGVVSADTDLTLYRSFRDPRYIQVTLQNDTLGYISVEDQYYFHIGSGVYGSGITPSDIEYPNAINIFFEDRFVFSDNKRIETINGVDYELLPNEVLIRKNSRFSTISARTSHKLFIDKSYEKYFVSSVIDETYANLLESIPPRPETYFETIPTIPIRDMSGWRQWMDMSSSKTLRSEKRMASILGFNVKTIAEEFYKQANENAHLMQYVFTHFCINVLNTDVGSIEYFYRFFKMIENSQSISIYDLKNGNPNSLFYHRFRPRNQINHFGGYTGNRSSLSFTTVVSTQYSDEEDYKKNKKYFLKNNDSKTFSRIKALVPELNSGVLRGRIITYCKKDRGTIYEVSVIDLQGSWSVTSYTRRWGHDWASMAYSGDNQGIMMPIPIGFWKTIPSLLREEVAARSMHITYLAAQWNKTSGWKRFIKFALKVVQIVMVALTIYFGVTSAISAAAGSAAGAVAGTVSLKQLILNMITNYVKSKVVGFVIGIAAKKLNIPFLSEMYQIFNMFQNGFDFNIGNILKLSTLALNSMNQYINTEMLKVQSQMQADAEYWSTAFAELEEAQKNLEQGKDAKMLAMIMETPEKFFGRTFGDTIEASFSILESDLLFNFENYLE